MKNFRVGFSKPRHTFFPIFSWAIRIFEGTPYSHVYLRWRTKWGTWICYQASGTALNFMGEKAFIYGLDVIEEFDLTCDDAAWEEVMEYCTRLSGTGYGLKGAVGMAVSYLLGKDKNIFGDGEKTQYCVELIARLLGNLGYNFNKDAEMVRLKDLNSFIRKVSEERRK